MTAVINVIPRQRPARAMRVLLGTTTKADILAFCPRARVGVGVESLDQDDKISTDIRWVQVPHNVNLWDALADDGDWIVEKSRGHFFIYADVDFRREFVIA